MDQRFILRNDYNKCLRRQEFDEIYAGSELEEPKVVDLIDWTFGIILIWCVLSLYPKIKKYPLYPNINFEKDDFCMV